LKTPLASTLDSTLTEGLHLPLHLRTLHACRLSTLTEGLHLPLRLRPVYSICIMVSLIGPPYYTRLPSVYTPLVFRNPAFWDKQDLFDWVAANKDHHCSIYWHKWELSPWTRSCMFLRVGMPTISYATVLSIKIILSLGLYWKNWGFLTRCCAFNLNVEKTFENMNLFQCGVTIMQSISSSVWLWHHKLFLI
jgi:hypothetical protein